ncbi:MAG: UDP-N-acetylmuramoyl-L-alanyl-D-glutamate--2,6-diaminopimelate ligase, partial [Hyphomonadaceae bacterium]|nr:UDP-N-acetylmuramoyl-L-alanyl-D-glutamate--2,6-diaminopimelate ligase [Hyphomonadaceae bacterium]
MKLGALFDAGVGDDARDVEITGLTADSRAVKPGYLFAALAGVAAHGREYVAQAKANGAAAVLSAGDLNG